MYPVIPTDCDREQSAAGRQEWRNSDPLRQAQGRLFDYAQNREPSTLFHSTRDDRRKETLGMT